ncbi:hypothetical protein HZB60_00470 [candidate division KSB1 bacterium]|nr:hypothetical protein [candidate division KSB1 bacterium]
MSAPDDLEHSLQSPGASSADLAVQQLADLAEQLRALPVQEPHPAAMVACLQAIEQAARPAAVDRPRWGVHSHRWAWVGAAMFVLCFSAWGSVNLSKRSLPGDVLYPVKRATERVCLMVTTDPQARCNLRMRRSEARLHEAVLTARLGRFDSRTVRELIQENGLTLCEIQACNPTDRGAARRFAGACNAQSGMLGAVICDLRGADSALVDSAIKFCMATGGRCCMIESCTPETHLKP